MPGDCEVFEVNVVRMELITFEKNGEPSYTYKSVCDPPNNNNEFFVSNNILSRVSAMEIEKGKYSCLAETFYILDCKKYCDLYRDSNNDNQVADHKKIYTCLAMYIENTHSEDTNDSSAIGGDKKKFVAKLHIAVCFNMHSFRFNSDKEECYFYMDKFFSYFAVCIKHYVGLNPHKKEHTLLGLINEAANRGYDKNSNNYCSVIPRYNCGEKYGR